MKKKKKAENKPDETKNVDVDVVYQKDHPLLSYKRDHDKNSYYKHFRPFSHDYRRLRMEEECQCPKTELHSTKCEWYHSEVIYILDTQTELSASEQAA